MIGAELSVKGVDLGFTESQAVVGDVRKVLFMKRRPLLTVGFSFVRSFCEFFNVFED